MQRKTVTVVFADVVGSTSLVERMEAESARRVLDRFFDTMRAVVERHGGVVEKFIGDAVMAVFGVPVVHEDDAVRALRAAHEMSEALERLNAELAASLGTTIAMRTGVETGEVVADDPARGHTFVTGNAVNVAARLETAAEPGQILVGPTAHRLVRHVCELEPLGQIALKGRSETTQVYRLVRLRLPGTQRASSAFVGRAAELTTLEAAFDATTTGRTTTLVTVIGPAGVGKSRLVQEFLTAHQGDARIVRGRCLPYGEGITYWPLKEVIGSAAELRGDETASETRRRIRQLMATAEDADLVADGLAETIGVTEAVPEHRGATWATRRFFEELARARPLVVVLDDIQWAEGAFLDLVEEVAGATERVPILVLCMARPELLEKRLSWATHSEHADEIVLEPLSREESEALLTAILGGARLDERARDRIVEASEGFPLFVEEMVAMLVDDGVLERQDGRWVARDLDRVVAPPTIHALLAARLDQLDPAERALLHRGAIEGQVFHRTAVEHMSPPAEQGAVADVLAGLVMKELVQPETAEFSEDDAYRFHHLLLRDVAYESVQKDERAGLHERFADWLDTQAGSRGTEYDEIAGYHLEQAYRYESELRPTVTHGQIAERAASRLGAAGTRAYARGDWPAAVSLLTRTVMLSPDDADARLKLADAKLELAPTTPSRIRAMRCVLRIPPGHDWGVRERAGTVVLQCRRCGREKRPWAGPEYQSHGVGWGGER